MIFAAQNFLSSTVELLSQFITIKVLQKTYMKYYKVYIQYSESGKKVYTLQNILMLSVYFFYGHTVHVH